MKKYLLIFRILGGVGVALMMAFWARYDFWDVTPSLILTVLGIGAGVLIAAVGMMIGTISNLANLAVNELPKKGVDKDNVRRFVGRLDSIIKESRDNTLLVVGVVFIELMLSMVHGSLWGHDFIWRSIFIFIAIFGFLLIWDVVKGMFTVYELHSEFSKSLLD